MQERGDEEAAEDHPLQLGSRGIELFLQGRQGDVEDRVVESDDHQAQRQHGKRLPTASVLDGIDRQGIHFLTWSAAWVPRENAVQARSADAGA